MIERHRSFFFCIHSAADALLWEGFIILEKPFLGIERGF